MGKVNLFVAVLITATFFGCNSSDKTTKTSSNNKNNSSEFISETKEDENKEIKVESYLNLNIDSRTLVWGLPAGNATITYSKEDPFLTIIDVIEDEEIGTISQGRELFIAEWLPAPNLSRPTLDGLGPLFNAKACTECHISDGRIAPYNNDNTLHNSFLIRVADKNGTEHPEFGGQLQTDATAGVAEASIMWSQSNSRGSIDFIIQPDLQADGYNVGGRMSPQLLGLGLLDLVSEATLLEYEDINDSNNDGISGRAHWVVEENETKIGRFGWKAINSSLRTQNAGALNQDMGLTSSVNPNENCTESQDICSNETNGGSPEVSEASLGAIVNFMTALGVPNRRVDNQERFDYGAKVFDALECSKCHRPTMRTGISAKFASLTNQTIYPYTDLLLHDMGTSLADGVVEKDATGNEFRTPPLWGIGIVAQKNGARFLHDGRASTIDEAIRLHDGEAKRSSDRYKQISPEDKERLLEFLNGI